MCRAASPAASERSVAVRVVETVADHEDDDATELPPLADGIDPDTLDGLFNATTTPGDTDARFSFGYIDHTVHVYADHSVEIEYYAIDHNPSTNAIRYNGPPELETPSPSRTNPSPHSREYSILVVWSGYTLTVCPPYSSDTYVSERFISELVSKSASRASGSMVCASGGSDTGSTPS